MSNFLRNSHNFFPFNKKMYTTLWLMQSWVDDRLAWNPDDWDGIQQLGLPAEEIWKPDLSCYNGQTELLQSSVYGKMTRAVISAEGKVTHVPTLKVISKTYIYIFNGLFSVILK